MNLRARLSLLLPGALLALASCTTTDTVDMRWELTASGACPGSTINPEYKDEQEVTLRYVERQGSYLRVCSNKLAEVLRKGGKPIVPMIERRHRWPGEWTSTCAIAGLVDNAPGGAECTFQGQVEAGWESKTETF